MATELVTVTYCDGCRSTEELAHHELSLDGARYALDVCAEHAGVIAELRDALERWRVPALTNRPSSRPSGSGANVMPRKRRASNRLDSPTLCPVCGRGFDYLSGLSLHAKTHAMTYAELREAQDAKGRADPASSPEDGAPDRPSLAPQTSG